MVKKRSWSGDDLKNAVAESYSIRSVLIKIGLVPAGGNYEQVKFEIKKLKLDASHFTGSRWNVGQTYKTKTRVQTLDMLVRNGTNQSFKLKRRLFQEGFKTQKCEICGWCEKSLDGRVPVELDHINGDRYDNRIENLRILCPNCHSLQSTHRGRNKKTALVNNLKEKLI